MAVSAQLRPYVSLPLHGVRDLDTTVDAFRVKVGSVAGRLTLYLQHVSYYKDLVCFMARVVCGLTPNRAVRAQSVYSPPLYRVTTVQSL